MYYVDAVLVTQLAAVAEKIRTVKSLQAVRRGSSIPSGARTVNKREHFAI